MLIQLHDKHFRSEQTLGMGKTETYFLSFIRKEGNVCREVGKRKEGKQEMEEEREDIRKGQERNFTLFQAAWKPCLHSI